MNSPAMNVLYLIIPGLVAILGNIIFYWIIKSRIDNKIERYKVQFSKLHNDRANLIKEIYADIVMLNEGIQLYKSTGITERTKDSFEDTKKLFWDFKHKIQTNRILFPGELRADLDSLITDYQDCISNIRRIAEYGDLMLENTNNPDALLHHSNVVEKSYDQLETIVKNKAPVVLQKLESQFQYLLGIEN